MSRNLTITKTGKQTKHGHAHQWLHLDSKGGTEQFRIQNQKRNLSPTICNGTVHTDRCLYARYASLLSNNNFRYSWPLMLEQTQSLSNTVPLCEVELKVHRCLQLWCPRILISLYKVNANYLSSISKEILCIHFFDIFCLSCMCSK